MNTKKEIKKWLNNFHAQRHAHAAVSQAKRQAKRGQPAGHFVPEEEAGRTMNEQAAAVADAVFGNMAKPIDEHSHLRWFMTHLAVLHDFLKFNHGKETPAMREAQRYLIDGYVRQGAPRDLLMVYLKEANDYIDTRKVVN
jgi:hypothetical protein